MRFFAIALGLLVSATLVGPIQAQPVRTTGWTGEWHRTDQDYAVVAGRIVDAYRQDPLPGASATVGAEGVRASGGAVSDLDGQFHFTVRPAEDLRFSAQFVGFNPLTFDLSLAPGDSLWVEARLDFEGFAICCYFAQPTLQAELVDQPGLDPALALISGVVTLADGGPMAGATVQIATGEVTVAVRSDESGRFDIGLPGGTYIFRVTPAEDPDEKGRCGPLTLTAYPRIDLRPGWRYEARLSYGIHLWRPAAPLTPPLRTH